MANLIGKIFNKKDKPRFSTEKYQQNDELKQLGLERVLCKMYNLVNHAIVPFQVGGTVDM